jgi:hypothetical protein
MGAMHAQVMYPGELAMSSGFVCSVEGLTACSALLRQVTHTALVNVCLGVYGICAAIRRPYRSPIVTYGGCAGWGTQLAANDMSTLLAAEPALLSNGTVTVQSLSTSLQGEQTNYDVTGSSVLGGGGEQGLGQAWLAVRVTPHLLSASRWMASLRVLEVNGGISLDDPAGICDSNDSILNHKQPTRRLSISIQHGPPFVDQILY